VRLVQRREGTEILFEAWQGFKRVGVLKLASFNDIWVAYDLKVEKGNPTTLLRLLRFAVSRRPNEDVVALVHKSADSRLKKVYERLGFIQEYDVLVRRKDK